MTSNQTPSPAYQQQLQDKIEQTRLEFAGFEPSGLDVFASPETGYRMRAEFKIWHEGEAISYAMFRSGQHKTPYTVEHYEAGSARMQALMKELLPLLERSQPLKRKLFQVEFLTSRLGQALVTLVYHKPLTDDWQAAAESLADTLGIHLVGRSRKQKRVVGQDHIFEEFTVAGVPYRYQQVEGAFSQPNAAVCQSMLEWVDRHRPAAGGDLLELYCGNGNFTLPLSRHFKRVLATEIAKSSIKSAQLNCQLNGIDTIQFVRMSSEELTQALNGTRPFRRLAEIALTEFNFSTVFVDPPRAGLDLATTELVSRFPHIIYISCNPETLKRDLLHLQNTHTVGRMALFDQFPYTAHRECGVILTRR